MRRQQHINKNNMGYAGLELTSQGSVSSIRLLCVTNCATVDYINFRNNNNLNNNFQRKLVPVPDQPLLLKWNNPIQRSLVRGRGISIVKVRYFSSTIKRGVQWFLSNMYR